jgi:glycosyltransferase involved in cell wall biosynthesis
VSRVLLVLRPDKGGAYRHVADLARGFAAAGHEVAVCGPLAHRAEDLSVPVLPVEMSRQISARRDSASLLALARAVRRFRPDVVHAHGTKASVYARAGRPAYPRVPVVYTPHGYPFSGRFREARTARTYRAIERTLSRLATRVICVCESERELACSVGPPERTRVVYNGTEQDPAAEVLPAMLESSSAGPVVAAVSEFRAGKGIDTLLQAWAEVAGVVPDARLVIAGDGPERARIEQLAADPRVADSVQLLGTTPGAGPVLAGTDLFVNPSSGGGLEWAESFPYTVLEGMAFGLPIVATDVGGVSEAIEDGETGVLVPPEDPNRLSEAIGRLLRDPGLAGRLGDGARVRHRERFTVERMVEGNLAVYGELGDWGNGAAPQASQ